MFDLRAEYVARFSALPSMQVCEAHDGEFDAGEIARLGAQRTPAIYVACMGLPDPYDDGGPSAGTWQWVAMVVARGPDRVREGKESAGDVAAALAMRIVHQLDQGAAFEAALDRPSRVRARNLFGSSSAQRGFRLWGVEWRQATRIRPEDLDAVLSNFELLHTDFDHGPADGTIDHSTEVSFTP